MTSCLTRGAWVLRLVDISNWFPYDASPERAVDHMLVYGIKPLPHLSLTNVGPSSRSFESVLPSYNCSLAHLTYPNSSHQHRQLITTPSTGSPQNANSKALPELLSQVCQVYRYGSLAYSPCWKGDHILTDHFDQQRLPRLPMNISQVSIMFQGC